MSPCRLILIAPILLIVGCQTLADRISEYPAVFSSLDPSIQQNIRNGIVASGYTTDMVYMALGKPSRTTTDGHGGSVWWYRHEPATAYNETIQAGFRRRVVFDPVKRTNDVIVEPIDTRAFPHLVPSTDRLTFAQGRLVRLEHLPSA